MIKRIDELNKSELEILKRQIIESNDFETLIYNETLFFFNIDGNIILLNIEESKFDSNGKTISILTRINKDINKLIDILIKEFHNIYILINNPLEINKYSKNLYISNYKKEGIVYGVNIFLCSDINNISKPLDYYICSQTPKLDFNNLKYYNLDSKEFEEFVKKNYTYDCNKLIWTLKDKQYLFGLNYTLYEPITHNNRYLLCTLKNKFNLETIVGVIKYNDKYDKYQIGENLYSTFITYVETNYFYWNKRIFNKMIEILLSHVPEQLLITSLESDMGKVVRTHQKILEKASAIRPTIDVINESEVLEYFKSKGLIK